jgi:D-ornithine 4,5-aminomutase subunit beta
MEEIIAVGGYFSAVEKGFFVDSAKYPERHGDGIARKIEGGVGAGAVYVREADYMAPVTAHFGNNNVEQYAPEFKNDPAKLIGGCSLEDRSKIVYIDELDETDNVNVRMAEVAKYYDTNFIKPEVQWLADGVVTIDLFLPTEKRKAEFAAKKFAEKMNLTDVEVVHIEVMHPSEGTRVQVKGVVGFDINLDDLEIPAEQEVLSDDEIRAMIEKRPMLLVAATVGEDEHSVGLREVIDIKHGGIEKYGIEVEYLGTSVPVEKLVDAAIELNADGILASTIISHDDIHYKNMKKLHEYAIEKGVRDKLCLAAGGTQVTPEIARKNGMDEGFGRGTKGVHIATFLVKCREEKTK